MPRILVTCTLTICFIYSLSGCAPKPYTNDAGITNSVVGPDLSHNGPFDSVHEARLGAGNLAGDNSASTASLPRLDITRGSAEDSGTIENVIPNSTKPFLAGVTYARFAPIVAETNAESKTYWLVGLNLTRTPDRAIYIMLRYPKGLRIEPGLSSDAIEFTTLDCQDLEVARRPANYYAPRKKGEAEPAEPQPDPAPEAGVCEFNNQAEAVKMAALVLKRYDQIRHYEGAPELTWQKLHAEVR